MNRYLKLVNFEISRFIKLYFVLIIMTIVIQFAGVIAESLGYVYQANRAIYEQSMSKAQYISQFGLLDFRQICNSFWFLVPIAICAVVLLGYTFLIWYRDWFAKSTFIYRLLMIPTSRLNIYFAKATAILLFVLGLIALELIILPLEISVFEKLVPAEFRIDNSLPNVISGVSELNLIIPRTFIQFVLYYLMGLMAVFLLFTGILFERSFGWKGLALGIVYAAVSAAVFISPIIILAATNSSTMIYPEEFLGLQVGLGLLVSAAAVFTSGYLIKNKVTV